MEKRLGLRKVTKNDLLQKMVQESATAKNIELLRRSMLAKPRVASINGTYNDAKIMRNSYNTMRNSSE